MGYNLVELSDEETAKMNVDLASQVLHLKSATICPLSLKWSPENNPKLYASIFTTAGTLPYRVKKIISTAV